MFNRSIKLIGIATMAATLVATTGILVVKIDTLSKLNTQLNQKLSESLNRTSDLNEQVNSLETSVSRGENKTTELQNKHKALEEAANCQELIKKTPDTGPFTYINKDIVGYYKYESNHLKELETGSYERKNDPEDNAAELKFVQGNVAKAQPLYDYYISQCGSK